MTFPLQNSIPKKLARILGQVGKPHRYVGEELHSVRKDPSAVNVRLALAFPDVYEIGMSHLGLRILYHLCNQRSGIAAERVFCPWLDMEEKMRQEKIPLFTLESKSPVSEFDVVGFSLQSEFTYTSVLNMIDLAGLNVFARDRKDPFPLIIAGGPCVANPEPLADFVDAFLIGDGEELLPEFMEKVAALKKRAISKSEMLRELAGIESVYVPSLYECTYDGSRVAVLRATAQGVPARVPRRAVRALEKKNYPAEPLVSAMELTHDRVSLEIMRGCTQGCRFCQAGFWYRPVREMDVDDVVDLARRGIASSGFSELGLCSLSTADYSAIGELTGRLKEIFKDQKIALSLPSLRADTLSVELAENVTTGRKTGFTFAPEAGSWRLRKVINKCITNEQLCETADIAYQRGWDLIKLYVMVGLPTETQQDLEELVALVRQINEIGRKYGKNKKVTVSIGSFVPKAWTPFQWEAFESRESLQKKIFFLKDRLGNKFTQVKWQDTESSTVEAALARGDRRMGRVLYEVWKDGGRFDGWSSQLSWERWQRAFAVGGVEMEWITRARDAQEVLPWDIVAAGVTKQYLWKEREKALCEELTADCRGGDCHFCGIQGAPEDTVLAKKSSAMENQVCPSGRMDGGRTGSTYRVRFAKKSELRYVSHLDLLRMFEMILRRADVPLVYSQGFHQRPCIHFGPSLSLGLTSDCEWTDFELYWGDSAQALEERLRQASCPGFEILEVRRLPGPMPSLSSIYDLARYEIGMDPAQWDFRKVDARLEEFARREEFWIEEKREKRTRRVDLRRAVRGVDAKRPLLYVTLSINDAGGNNTNPYVFLKEALGWSLPDAQALDIRRVELLSSK